MERERACAHVCLAGEQVTCDWKLLHELARDSVLTLIARICGLERCAAWRTADVIVFDCSGCGGRIARPLGLVHHAFSGPIVLVDGGLSPRQVAAAYRSGIKDYFAAPYDRKLLAERIRHLCVQHVRNGTSPNRFPADG